MQIQSKFRLHLAEIRGSIFVSDQVAEICNACDRKEDLRAFLFCTKIHGENMPKKTIKPFVTYSDQLNILIQKKQLNISDTSYAVRKLHDIGYYSLIDGYKDIFYNPMTRTYENGTKFTDLVSIIY